MLLAQCKFSLVNYRRMRKHVDSIDSFLVYNHYGSSFRDSREIAMILDMWHNAIEIVSKKGDK